MNEFGFARVTAASPTVSVGNPRKNVDAALAVLAKVTDSDVVVFPELHLSGYTCRDLFRSQTLLAAVEAELGRMAQGCTACDQLVFVGAPIGVGNELFNCAVAIHRGSMVGIVPKQNIPNYGEFEESRWFRGASGGEPREIWFAGQTVLFGTDLLFRAVGQGTELIVGAEICEDLWMPIPPSSFQALGGATLLVNLSASNETVGKSEYRRQLVSNQSGRCVAAYAYAGAGPSESTTDLVFGGHCLITENGALLAESSRVGAIDDPLGWGEKIITADVDIQKLQTERRLMTSFGEASHAQRRPHRLVSFACQRELAGLQRTVDPRPFVPKDSASLGARCAEVFGIQCAGLYRRLESIGWPDIHVGISGGLDSTLALIVAARTFQAKGLPLTKIHGITMPGFGTTAKTKSNALRLMTALGIRSETVDIRELCLRTFESLDHRPFGLELNASGAAASPETDVARMQAALSDLTDTQRAAGDLNFENVQARIRTLILMSHGFVLGTGDLSELALGWCTYNADHMSMYNPNAGVPKTLVKFLIEWVAEHEFRQLGDGPDSAFAILNSVALTTISPELLPADKQGEIAQSTEAVLGPYELHDFYLKHFIRDGFSPEKILFLAEHATFSQAYSRELRERTLALFLRRFFAQQYKRSCLPDSPKVGSVSLSPRGDWRMPSDADAEIWLSQNALLHERK